MNAQTDQFRVLMDMQKSLGALTADMKNIKSDIGTIQKDITEINTAIDNLDRWRIKVVAWAGGVATILTVVFNAGWYWLTRRN